MSVFDDLKNRKVYRAAAGYAVAAWLTLQISVAVRPILGLPNWTLKVVVGFLFLGFAAALLIGWLQDRSQNDRSKIFARSQRFRHLLLASLAIAPAMLVALGFLLFYHPSQKDGRTERHLGPERSIAVLPFENLSLDPENAFFSTGIQDEILTRLAKLGDLRVISRTSTERYRSKPENLREVARQLGVAYILEGSVQRTAAKLRVNVQLIDAANDVHRWAEIYDRDPADLLTLQSEVAEKIAHALNVQLSGGEKKALAKKPTDDTAAYEAYLKGLAGEAGTQNYKAYEDVLQNFGEAVRLDPKFTLAWCHLSVAESFVYFTQWEHTPVRLAAAKQAADTAVTLQPDLGEVLLARGYYYYYGEQNYAAAVRDFGEASKRLPNSSDALTASAYVLRRQGQWKEVLSQFEQASRLDPRNALMFYEWGSTEAMLRHFPAARALLERALEINPGDPDVVTAEAATYQAEGDLPAAAKLLAQLPPLQGDANGAVLQKTQWLYERRFEVLINACQTELAKAGVLDESTRGWVLFTLGLAQARSGDVAAARTSFEDGAAFMQNLLATTPDDPFAVGYVALLHAAIGDRASALREGEHAVQLVAHDAMLRPRMELILAEVHALLGEPDAAIEELQHLLSAPGKELTPALLQLDPVWDDLRSDERFQKLSMARPAS